MSVASKEKLQCPLCSRRADLTFHHYIPRKVHRRTHFKKHYTKAELQRGVNICVLCHRGIHKFHDEMALAREFNDLDSLKSDPGLSNHFMWVAKQRISS